MPKFIVHIEDEDVDMQEVQNALEDVFEDSVIRVEKYSNELNHSHDDGEFKE